VPALVAAKATVGVAIFIGVAILVFGAVYYSIVTIIVRTRALRPRGRSSRPRLPAPVGVCGPAAGRRAPCVRLHDMYVTRPVSEVSRAAPLESAESGTS